MKLDNKNIFLHIGTPKTGTTAVQNALQKMQHDGILSNLNFQFHNKGLPDIWRQCICFRDDINYLKKIFYEELKRYTKNNDGYIKNNIVLSAEHFSVINKQNNFILSPFFASLFFEIFKTSNVKVIIYLRRQDLFYESFMSQHIKGALFRTSPTEYKNIIEHSLHYKTIIDEYAQYFGKENVIVRIFDRDMLKNNDIVCDFLDVLDLTSLRCYNKNKINLSLSPEALRIKSTLNAKYCLSKNEEICALAQCEEDFTLGKIDKRIYAHSKVNVHSSNYFERAIQFSNVEKLLLLANSGSFSNTGFMQPDERREFLAQYEEDNAAIAREYFGREDGKLFNDKFPENIVSLDEPSTTDIVTVFLPIFQHLHERIEHLERQVANTQNTQHTKNIETRLNTIERRLGYIKAPWKVLPVIVRRVCKKFNMQEKTPALYAFMRSVYRKCNFLK